MKLSELLAEARASLATSGVDGSGFDARLLVEHFSATTRTEMVTQPDMVLENGAVEAVRAAVARRMAGEPTHRIIGFREFYGLKLLLSSETLEPRPDTETLVDAILPLLRKRAAGKDEVRVLDLGTGTGAIALALLSELSCLRAVGVDISADALATATRNAMENGLSARFQPVQSDWFEKISGVFHAIVSNPPYISSGELDALQGEVRDFDPERALDGGPDGLDAYRTIAEQAGAYLVHGGVVAVEIGHTQKAEVVGLFAVNGFRLVEARQDFGARDRVLVFVQEEEVPA